MRRVPLVLALALLSSSGFLFPAPGIAQTAQPPVTCAPGSPHGNTASWPLVSGNDAFGFRLFDALYGHRKGPNVVISPISVALALDLASAGARGATAVQMARTLGAPTLSQSRMSLLAGSLLRALHSGDRQVQLRIANSLWAQNNLPLVPAFRTVAQYRYGAQVANLDLNSGAAPRVINGWVSCATEGHIKQIVASTAGNLLLLLNAVYFHGIWSDPFERRQTEMQPFTTGSGAVKRVPLMHEQGYFSYYGAPNFQAISLPYGRGRFSMAVVLPHRGTTLAALTQQLSLPVWQGWMSHLRSADVDLSLPRFTVRNSFTLSSTLSALGMGRAFHNANFSGMCASCVISEVLHKTYLHVYERGTVAAAVTAVILSGGGAPGPPPIIMRVDHPFLVAIRDHKTGAVLFLGAINAP